MNLIEEAVAIEILGIRMYAFGAYVCLGALCALITLCALCRYRGMKPGTAPLAFLCSTVCGVVVSRLFFCLGNQELGFMMPLSSWIQVSGGGWSLFGLLGGMFLGGWLAAKIAGERADRLSDLLSVAVLPLIVAERIGENRIVDFNVSRPVTNELIANSFLATGEYDRYVMTYYICAAACLVLFAAMLAALVRSRRDGDTAVTFLILFGAVSILLESMRYDLFLSISFVKIQQVCAALMLGLGIWLAAKRGGSCRSPLAIAAFVSLPVMVCAVIGLEFALDRTDWDHILVYAVMILTIAVPAALGLILLNKGKESRTA